MLLSFIHRTVAMTHRSRFVPNTDSRSIQRRRGFTLPEAMIVVVVLGVMFSISLPRFNETTRQRRVISAATTLNADIPIAFSLAARQRKPVTLTYDAANGEVRVADRLTPSTIYLRRALRSTSEYQIDSVTMTPASVQIFPNGVASAPFTLRLFNGSFVRQISVGRTGHTRVTVQ